MMQTSHGRTDRWMWMAAILMVALAFGRLWWMPAHASLNVNEGWNAAHAQRLFGPGSLYPDPGALIANNYPPLSFVVVGALGLLLGNDILAGQIISLVSEIGTGLIVWAIVARLTDRRWATAAALLFMGFAVTLLRKYLAIDDPQWFGQALMASALLLLVPAEDRPVSAKRIVSAAALVVAGGMVKHNIVALPVTATLWLALVDRRALILWLAAVAAFAAAACLAILAIWGTVAFVDVLAPARSYSWLRASAHGGALFLATLPGLIAGRPLFSLRQDDRRLLLLPLLLLVALGLAIVQRSGEGVSINSAFETVFALVICVGVGCGMRPDHPWRWFGIATLPALALAPVALAADVRELTGRDAAIRRWAPVIRRLARTEGPVISIWIKRKIII